MSKDRWYAVRCCCTPNTIYGFMKLPESTEDARGVTVIDRHGSHHHVHLKRVGHSAYDRDATLTAMPHVSDEIAIYSDDRGIEFWRRIDGFVEVQKPQLRDMTPGYIDIGVTPKE
jgi:hypothetical protein